MATNKYGQKCARCARWTSAGKGTLRLTDIGWDVTCAACQRGIEADAVAEDAAIAKDMADTHAAQTVADATRARRDAAVAAWEMAGRPMVGPTMDAMVAAC